MSAENEMLLRTMRDRADKLQTISETIEDLRQIFEDDMRLLLANNE